MKESILSFKAGEVTALFSDGIYKAGKRDSYELLDDVIVKNGKIVSNFRLKGRMIWGQRNLENEIKNGTEIIIKNDSFVPYTKKPGDSNMAPTKLIPPQIVGDILSANAEMSLLFNKKVFSYPKPVSLLEYLLGYLGDDDLYFLDFFSGSGTSAQALMQYNAKNGTHRKFILVQLPEDLDDNLKTADDKEKVVLKNAIELCNMLHVSHKLTEVGKERIRRAGKKLLEEMKPDVETGGLFATAEAGKPKLDVGFRVLKLDTSNMEDVYYRPDESSESTLFEDNVKPDRSGEDLLFQVMLECNLPLSAKIQTEKIAGKEVFSVNNGYLIACFDEDVNEEVITAVAKRKPYYFIMRDKSLSSDNVADNFEQIFQAYSKETIRRIL